MRPGGATAWLVVLAVPYKLHRVSLSFSTASQSRFLTKLTAILHVFSKCYVVIGAVIVGTCRCCCWFGALAGTFPVSCRLRFVGCFDTSESIASRSCVFASVSYLASTHFLRWCLAGAVLLQSCCKVQRSVHRQQIFSIDTRSSTSAVQSLYWTLNVRSPLSCPAAARAAWSPGSMHTSWPEYIVMVAALQSRLAQYIAHKPISHAPLSTCSTTRTTQHHHPNCTLVVGTGRAKGATNSGGGVRQRVCDGGH